MNSRFQSPALFNARWRAATLLCALVTLHCGGVDSLFPPAAPAQLSLSPSNPQIAQGTAQQFSVRGLYASGHHRDLTQAVRFSVSAPDGKTLPMGPDGLLQLDQPGRYQVSAELADRSVVTTITVTAATLTALRLSPTTPQVPKGLAQAFAATASFSDGTTQNVSGVSAWSAKDLMGSGVVILSSKGVATAKNVGQASITTRYKTLSASTTLQVTPASLTALAISPQNPTLVAGGSLTFGAQGTYSDGTVQDVTAAADWAVTDLVGSGVASIADSTVVADSAGQSTVSVYYQGIEADTTLRVTSVKLTSIALTPSNPSVKKGTTQQFTATGTYSDGTTQGLTGMVSWTATDIAPGRGVATIGASGLATGNQAGQASITASYLGLTASTPLTVTAPTLMSIAITPLNPAIAKGTPQQFTATGTYSDSSTQDITPLVTWASLYNTVATIGNAAGSQGLASGVGVGATTISAALGAVTASTPLAVTAASLVSISVTPQNLSIAKGPPQQFTATGTYTDGATQNLTALVSWTSSNSSVATMSSAAGTEGLASEAGVGATTISATLGVKTARTPLTITVATLVSISVTPNNATIDLGAVTTRQFTATGTYTDGSTQNLTTLVNWTSADPSLATISNDVGTQGLATGVRPGSTIISASPGGTIGRTILTINTSFQGFQTGTTFATDTYPSCVAVGELNSVYTFPHTLAHSLPRLHVRYTNGSFSAECRHRRQVYPKSEGC